MEALKCLRLSSGKSELRNFLVPRWSFGSSIGLSTMDTIGFTGCVQCKQNLPRVLILFIYFLSSGPIIRNLITTMVTMMSMRNIIDCTLCPNEIIFYLYFLLSIRVRFLRPPKILPNKILEYSTNTFHFRYLSRPHHFRSLTPHLRSRVRWNLHYVDSVSSPACRASERS